jgi:hypothetical protein
LPRRTAGVSGSELSQTVAPASWGSAPWTGNWLSRSSQ